MTSWHPFETPCPFLALAWTPCLLEDSCVFDVAGNCGRFEHLRAFCANRLFLLGDDISSQSRKSGGSVDALRVAVVSLEPQETCGVTLFQLCCSEIQEYDRETQRRKMSKSYNARSSAVLRLCAAMCSFVTPAYWLLLLCILFVPGTVFQVSDICFHKQAQDSAQCLQANKSCRSQPPSLTRHKQAARTLLDETRFGVGYLAPFCSHSDS